MKPSVGCLRSRCAGAVNMAMLNRMKSLAMGVFCNSACMLGWRWQEYIRDQKRLQLRIAGAGRLQWSLIKSIKNSKASQSQAALVRQSVIAVARPRRGQHLSAALHHCVQPVGATLFPPKQSG